MFPLGKIFAKFTRRKFQKFRHLIKIHDTKVSENFIPLKLNFQKWKKQPWYFTVWETHFVLFRKFLSQIPKQKCLNMFWRYRQVSSSKFFFDQFLMINLIFYYRGHLVLTALFPIPTSVIPRLSFFWTLSFMLSVKKKKQQIVENSQRKPGNIVLLAQSLNRTNKEQISLPKSCSAVLYFIDQLHGYLCDYIK